MEIKEILKRHALAVAVHVSAKSLRFAELEGTKPTLVDLPTIVLSFLPAAFLLSITCPNFNQLVPTSIYTLDSGHYPLNPN